MASLEQAGAEVRELTPESDPLPAALDGCDGVLLTGGADVDPGEYGEADRHPTVELDPVRDDYELALARLALDARPAAARDLPRRAGAQRRRRRHADSGHPELSSRRDLAHSIDEADDAIAHDVAVDAGHVPVGAARRRSSTDGRVAVNSRHHQSVKTPAPGFVVSATAPDGVVEAIEKPDARLLRRRAVAPGELLADGRVLDAVRRPRGRGAPTGRSPPSRVDARSDTFTDRTPRSSRRAACSETNRTRRSTSASSPRRRGAPRRARASADRRTRRRRAARTSAITPASASGPTPVRGGSSTTRSGAGSQRHAPRASSTEARRRRRRSGQRRGVLREIGGARSVAFDGHARARRGAASATANKPTPA